MKIAGNERIALVGATGSGKTFFARLLLRNSSRLLVFDPKDTLKNKWGLKDWSRKSKKALDRGEPFRARFAPEPGEEWRYEQLFKNVYDAGNCLIYIDEVYGIVPPQKRTPPIYFTAVYTRGRELGIGVIAASQRPSWIPLFVLSEANWYACFRLMMDEDRKRMAAFMGKKVLDTPVDPYGFYLYHTGWRTSEAVYYPKVSGRSP